MSKPITVKEAGEWADKVWPECVEQAYAQKEPAKWVGLTEAQCGVLWKTNMTPFEYYQAIEAKLKEKNT